MNHLIAAALAALLVTACSMPLDKADKLTPEDNANLELPVGRPAAASSPPATVVQPMRVYLGEPAVMPKVIPLPSLADMPPLNIK